MKITWRQGENKLWYEVLDGKYGRDELTSGNAISVKASYSSLWKHMVSLRNKIDDFSFCLLEIAITF